MHFDSQLPELKKEFHYSLLIVVARAAAQATGISVCTSIAVLQPCVLIKPQLCQLAVRVLALQTL
jgi:hypothetical protein